MVIINDGSTDNSKKIIAKYLRDERIRCIYQKNSGFSAAINRGIKESRAELIAFIGQDDLWMPEKLKLQIAYVRKHKNIGLLHSSYFFINSDGLTTSIIKKGARDFSSRNAVIARLFLSNFVGFETVLVKKQCFDEVGFLDERMVGFSDHDMWLRIAGSFNIGYLDLPLVKKRQHELQLSWDKTDDVLRDEFLLVRKAIDRYPFLSDFEPEKLASLYYSWGTTLLQKGHKEIAKQKLLKAFLIQPSKFKAIIAYVAPNLYLLALSQYQKLLQGLNRSI